MKFNVETISSVKKMLHVEIPKEDVKKALDNAYSKLNKTAKVKGFRPGKVPRPVLEKLYGNNIHQDVSSEMIQNGLSEVLQESNLKFVGCKNIDPPKLEPENPYFFDIEIDVKPEIDKINFKGLKLERLLYTVTIEEVEVQLKMLQKNVAKKQSVGKNRPAKDGDFVVIDYEGFKDGKLFQEVGKLENFNIKVGASTISADLDRGIVGMNLGEEKEILVEFPDDYNDAKISGLKIDFKVKLKDIMEEILPEINDDMAKSLGPFESLDALKKKIYQNLKEGYEKRKEQELNEQIFTQLIEKTQFELPESLVQQELNTIIADAERSFQYYNKSLEDAGLTRKVLEKRYDEVARKQVRRQLILGQIIQQEKMLVSDDALEEGFKNISSNPNYNGSLEDIKTFYNKNPDKLDLFKHALLEKQVMDVIINNSSVEEVEPKSVK